MNAWDEPKDDVRRGVETFGVKHRVLLDGEAVFKRYGAYIPSILWINAAGEVVNTELGFHGPEPLEAKTKALLSGDR